LHKAGESETEMTAGNVADICAMPPATRHVSTPL